MSKILPELLPCVKRIIPVEIFHYERDVGFCKNLGSVDSG
jgi:hypothetical protein